MVKQIMVSGCPELPNAPHGFGEFMFYESTFLNGETKI